MIASDSKPKCTDIDVEEETLLSEDYLTNQITALAPKILTMKIEITNEFVEGKEVFRFTMTDGPDGCEEIRGLATDLPETFAKLIEWRIRIAEAYLQDDKPPFTQAAGELS